MSLKKSRVARGHLGFTLSTPSRLDMGPNNMVSDVETVTPEEEPPQKTAASRPRFLRPKSTGEPLDLTSFVMVLFEDLPPDLKRSELIELAAQRVYRSAKPLYPEATPDKIGRLLYDQMTQ